MTTIQDRAAAEVDTFVRVRALCSDQKRLTKGFRLSLSNLIKTGPAPLASAMLAELNRRDRLTYERTLNWSYVA